MTLVVLAHPRDTGAQHLVERWRPRDARLLQARDLSSPGWRHHVASPGEDVAVIGGERIRVGDIAAVVTRVPQIRAQDLPHIAQGDREYVAAEIHAFLTSWLASLDCPVLNRPSAASLVGPALSDERWQILAARAGLQLLSSRRRAPEPELVPAMAIASVVGDRWFGAVSDEIGERAVKLGRYVGLDLLTVRFTSATRDGLFLSADPMIDLTPEVSDALLAWIDRRAAS